MGVLDAALAQAEQGRIPDALVRAGIRRLLAQRLREENAGGVEAQAARFNALIDHMDDAPIAPRAEVANEQHYEVPASLFEHVLGPRLKYSGCLWDEGVQDLAQAEEAMLARYCERASIEDGQRILDLGCGWGSLALWLAEHYPNARITAVSNSTSQKAFIEARRDRLGADNLQVHAVDANDLDAPALTGGEPFDRVLSVEMFEHMRNWRTLLARIASWLKPDGVFFAHVFCHRYHLYRFEARDASDWMAAHFFTEGLMPADELFAHFQDDLRVERRWRVSGEHYRKTQEAWLARMDAARETVMPILEETYGRRDAERWFQRWRLFFLACSELFGYRHGDEWYVVHYRMGKRGGPSV